MSNNASLLVSHANNATVHEISPAMAAELAIRDKYTEKGEAGGFLGNPTSDVVDIGNFGFCRHYDGGSIYWTQATGAHEVHGDIRGKWASLGWERGFLGYPVSDETGTPDGVGRYNHFQGGSIYWTPSTGAHEVHGDIRGKWASLGWERGFLGYPVGDETGTADGQGRFSDFQGGWIYWSPRSGAREVHGAIPEHIDFDIGAIVLPTGVALGGRSHVTLSKEGGVEFKGSMHDSGSLAYNYSVGCVITDADDRAYTLGHTGSVAGTFESGSRDDFWDGNVQNALVNQNWRSLVARSRATWQTRVNTDIGSLLGTILTSVGTVAAVIALIV